MAGERSDESALETARARFVESLPRKSVELGASVAALAGAQVASPGHQELRQRLHALYASALVFRLPELCATLEQAIATLDRAAERGGKLAAEELASVAEVVSGLARVAPPAAGGSAFPDGDDEPSQIMRAVQRFNADLPEERTLPRVDPRALASARPRRRAESEPIVTRTLRVLVLAPADRSVLAPALESEALQVDVVTDAEALLAAAREEPPDVVLADAALAHATHLTAQLRGDPLTDYLPVVLFRAAGQGALALDALRSHVDAVLTMPISGAELLRVLGRVTGTLLESDSPLAELGASSLSLSELAEWVGESVRRGILDAAEGAHATQVPIGADAQVRAAALATIAQVRAFVEEQSGGRVRFDERGLGGHPGLLQLAGGVRDDVDLAALAGRRVLLVDDDTGVVVLLAGLLRSQGSIVVEATDGDEALASARTERPDLVITDVLMPGRDGLSFCREIALDPLLADVPVLLIPSKEELLLCIRDNALGEAGSRRRTEIGRRVLCQAALALLPRLSLDEELRGGGEVRGSIESTGVVALLRSVRRTRPDARILLRDAWNTFELLMCEGRLARLTRTAADGSFVRDEQALPQLLGVSSGRFAVEPSVQPCKPSVAGTLDEALTRGADELGAQLGAVRMPALVAVSRVVFDEDALTTLTKQGSSSVRRAVGALVAGMGAADAARASGVDLSTIAALLAAFTRRGVVREVLGHAGEDAVASAREAQRARIPAALQSPLSRIPPPPAPVISVLPPAPGDTYTRPTLPDSAPPAAALDSIGPSTPPGRGRWGIWGAGLVALMAVGFLLGRRRDPALPVAAAPVVAPPVSAAPAAPGVDAPVGEQVLAVQSPPPRPQVSAYIPPDEIGFRVASGLPKELPVPAGQGALVVELAPGLEGATLTIDDRPHGVLPQRLALPEGVHELAVSHGDAVSYRFVFVRPGFTYTLAEL